MCERLAENGETVCFIRALTPHMTTTDWEQQDHEGFSTIHYLVKVNVLRGRQELVAEQLLRIATCTVRNSMGHIPLAYAPESVRDHSTASKLVLLAKDNIESVDSMGGTS